MNKCICTLEPKAIWENFYKLTQVPRPSNHEEKSQRIRYELGKRKRNPCWNGRGSQYIIEQTGNPGMENRKGVILQGHLDMVPQKNEDKQHDFTKDPISAYVDGGMG